MRIAIFDYRTIPNNPVGSLHRRIIAEQCDEHEFVVFACQFDNPRPDKVRFVRVPVPTRPLAVLFVAYHLIAPLVYLFYRLRGGKRFDLIQMVESNLLFPRADLSGSHFCHGFFLKRHWQTVKGTGLRSWLRWWDHRLHALMEPLVYRRVGHVMVPSKGLERELTSRHPSVAAKLTYIPNPVDIPRMQVPADFDRDGFRAGHNAGPGDTVLTFIALGHFERKGLVLILEALRELNDPAVKLQIIGGEDDLVRIWRAKVDAMGLSRQVTLLGKQKDVRAYLWAADAFVLPSAYEVFPLVALEAAAAGCCMIVSKVNGIEEFVVDGHNGILIERTAAGVRDGIRRLRDGAAGGLARRLGAQAQRDVQRYSIDHYQDAWRALYRRFGRPTDFPDASRRDVPQGAAPADVGGRQSVPGDRL